MTDQPQQPDISPAAYVADNQTPLPTQGQPFPASTIPGQSPLPPVDQAETLPDGTPVSSGVPAADPLNADRIAAFKKNLAYMWMESIAMTGLPVDVLLQQVFTHSAQRNLPSNGTMIDYGQGPGFAPDQPTLESWLNAYFDRVLATRGGSTMAEE